MRSKQAGKVGLGILLMLAAGAALVVIYSMRPPEGIGDAVRIISKGQDYIREPYYQVLLGVAGVTALIGTILFIVGLTGRK
jgi:hypothetical protein